MELQGQMIRVEYFSKIFFIAANDLPSRLDTLTTVSTMADATKLPVVVE
jgi:hypothetical protein